MRRVTGAGGPVVIRPASGTGAWEAAPVGALSPGEAALRARTGWFATLWRETAAEDGFAAAMAVLAEPGGSD